ncbi:hypothetical protein AGMMS49944_22340 [Spirochaetia bacterium]|nr:hypothetical protein AGMMS49944_22340 [Spirochaetia bacterium]
MAFCSSCGTNTAKRIAGISVLVLCMGTLFSCKLVPSKRIIALDESNVRVEGVLAPYLTVSSFTLFSPVIKTWGGKEEPTVSISIDITKTADITADELVKTGKISRLDPDPKYDKISLSAYPIDGNGAPFQTGGWSPSLFHGPQARYNNPSLFEFLEQSPVGTTKNFVYKINPGAKRTDINNKDVGAVMCDTTGVLLQTDLN